MVSDDNSLTTIIQNSRGEIINLKSEATPSVIKGRIMNNHNPNDRVYVRPSKPVNEMTPEEIRAFAEEVYDRIMGTLPERKVDDES